MHTLKKPGSVVELAFVAWLVALAPAILVGCEGLLGVDFEAAHAELDGGEAGTPLLDGAHSQDAPGKPTHADASDAGRMDGGADGDATLHQDSGIPPCATPTLTPPGGTFTSPVTVMMTSTTPGATLYYTTNGMTPTVTMTSSTVSVYDPTTGVKVADSETIEAICTAPGHAESDVSAPQVYDIELLSGTVATPVPNPPSGTYSNDLSVYLTTATADGGTKGATICYDVDGGVPSCADGGCAPTSTTYDVQSPIAVNSTNGPTVLVQAIACKAGMANSAPVQLTYALQVATPAMLAPSPGVVAFSATGATPTVSSTTAGATFRYTVSAAGPACADVQEEPPEAGVKVSLNEADAGSTTYRVVACKAGYAPSFELDAPYVVKLAPPTFVPPASIHSYDNVVSVDVLDALSTGASGAYVCVTTDGGAPGCSDAATGCSPGQRAVDGGLVVDVNGTALEAVSCGPAYAPSAPTFSGGYDLKLDPLAFVPATGTVIPDGGLEVTLQDSVSTSRRYDYICFSTNGATPTCACAGAGVTDRAVTDASTSAIPAITLHGIPSGTTTIRAIGCLNATGDAPTGVAFAPSDTPPSVAAYPNANTMAPPTLLPLATVAPSTAIAATAASTAYFRNNDKVPAYFCFTTATPPSSPALPSCGTTGTTCGPGASLVGSSSGVASGGTTLALTGDPVIGAPSPTGVAVQVVACDVAHEKAPSLALNGPIVYEPPAVATPAIAVSPAPKNGLVAIGALLTFSTSTPGATFHYAIDGSGASCSSGLTVSATGAAAPFTATYATTGAEVGGAVNVIACESGFSPSGVTSETLTFTVATPTFKYGTNPAYTFDDYVNELVTVSPSAPDAWLCAGPGAACGATALTCAGPSNVYSVTNASNPAFTVPAQASPEAVLAGTWSAAVTATATSLNLVACATATRASGAPFVVGSNSATASYTLKVSGLASQTEAAGAVLVHLTPTTALPNGSNGSPSVLATTNDAYLCVSLKLAPPPQSYYCDSTFIASLVSSGWQCNAGDTGDGGVGDGGVSGGILITPGNDSLSAFACKTGLNFSTLLVP